MCFEIKDLLHLSFYTTFCWLFWFKFVPNFAMMHSLMIQLIHVGPTATDDYADVCADEVINLIVDANCLNEQWLKIFWDDVSRWFIKGGAMFWLDDNNVIAASSFSWVYFGLRVILFYFPSWHMQYVCKHSKGCCSV